MSTTEYQALAQDAFDTMRHQFKSLKKTTVRQRIQELAKLREAMLDKREKLVDALMTECGKTRTDANIEFIGTVDWLKWLEDHAEKLLADEKVPTPITLMGKKSRIIREGMGVILVIAPWNYPLHIGITQIFTAFACGNTTVYKPSEVTPMQGLYEEIFAASDMISKSVSVVYGTGALGAALIDQVPEKIFFTGSTRTGKVICKQAAEHVIPVDMELGGKDPMIVFDSASIRRAVAGAVWGAFTHNGQSCSAVERLYVQDTIYDEFVAKMKEETEKLIQQTMDDGTADIGRLTVDFQYNIVKDHVEDAKAKGAKVLTGGNEIDAEKLLFQPTILLNTTTDMKAVAEETFGPVVPVMKFNTEAEAIEMANDSEFGLQASVFSADLAQAYRVAQALEVGGVSINNVNMVEGNPWLSFGGRKQSGWGRARGVEGLHAFTRSKHILVDPNSDNIEVNWYPYTGAKYKQILRFINALFVRSPARLLKVALVGLPLEKIANKSRDNV